MDTITADSSHQPKHIKNLFGIKSAGDSNIGCTLDGAALPTTPTTPSRRFAPRKSTMRVADVEAMLRYQLFLLSSYMEFMDDMKIDDDVEGAVGHEAGVEAAAAAAEEAVVYGDARILRRLPKHVRNLSRHVNRLLANCDDQRGSRSKPRLSDRVREELSCLDKMLGIESD